MSLAYSYVDLTAKSMYKKSKLNIFIYTLLVQRGFVWERSRKSALIESLILGYPVPQLFAKRVERDTEKYYILDGKQRISAIVGFINDDYRLTKLPILEYKDSTTGEIIKYELTGKKFSELPEELQDRINDTSFRIIYFDNLEKDEEAEVFRRLNAGKPLSTKSKLLASIKDLEKVVELGGHDLFSDMLSEKAMDNKNYVSIIMKMWCMINMDIKNISFESKAFNPLMETTALTEEQSNKLLKVFDYLFDTHSELMNRNKGIIAKRFYTETHIVSLVPFVDIAIENNIELKDFCDWIEIFFGTDDVTSISEEYNESCTGGSAKSTNIMKRHIALEESFNGLFDLNDINIDLVEIKDIVDDILEDIE